MRCRRSLTSAGLGAAPAAIVRLTAAALLALALAGCESSTVNPVAAYIVPPVMARPGPGEISLCYNRVTESTAHLRQMVKDVCRDPQLVSNRVNLDTCSLFSPAEARFRCAHVERSLAEERPQMPLDALR